MGVTRWQTEGGGVWARRTGRPGRGAPRPSLQGLTGELAAAVSGAGRPRGPRRRVFFGVLFAPRGSSRPRHGSSLPVPATAPSLPAAQLP